MPLVFKLDKDQPHREIVGLGYFDADAVVAVEGGAAGVAELQDEDGRPLTGARLASAARGFAKEMGLKVEEVSEKRYSETMLAEGDRPPLHQVAREEYERMFGMANAQAPDDLTGKNLAEAKEEK